MGEPSGRLRLSVMRMVPSLSWARSAPVSTATTPGDASAAFASMRRMRAWAWSERTTTMWVWPGRLTSP